MAQTARFRRRDGRLVDVNKEAAAVNCFLSLNGALKLLDGKTLAS